MEKLQQNGGLQLRGDEVENNSGNNLSLALIFPDMI